MSIGLLAVALLLGGGKENYQLGFLDIGAHSSFASASSFGTSAATGPVPVFKVELRPVEVEVPVLTPLSPALPGFVTHYGASYNGSVLGCGFGMYDTNNPEIIAVGPAHYGEWPCGTRIQVCGSAGCIVGVRHDGCPGCGPYHLDLSEAGIAHVCGDQAAVCRVQIQQVELSTEVEYRPAHWLSN